MRGLRAAVLTFNFRAARSRSEGPATSSRELQPSAKGRLRAAELPHASPFGAQLAKRTQRAARELRAFARRSCGPPTSVRSKRMMRCSGRSLRRGATCGPSRGEAAARRRLRRRTVRHTHSCDLRANLHLSDRRLRSVRMAVRAAARRSPTESNPAARDDARKPAEVSSAPPRQPAALCGIEPEPRPLVGDGASTVSIKKSAVPGSFYSLN